MTRAALLFALLVGCATTHTGAPPVDTGPTASTSEASTASEPGDGCPANGLLRLEGGIGELSALKLVSELTACKGRTVVLAINSGGGSIFAAQTMQKAIEAHDRPVLCVVDGMAASAAFVTLQSCSARYMTERSVLMAHEGSVSTGGQSTELTNGAELLRVLNWGMAAFCARRMGTTVAAFQSHVSGGQEWWFSQADALREHAIDAPALDLAEIVKLASEI